MAILSQALYRYSEGAETRWCTSMVVRKTSRTSDILIGKAKDGDIVLGAMKVAQTRIPWFSVRVRVVAPIKPE